MSAPCICADDDKRGVAGGECTRCGGLIPDEPGFVVYCSDAEFVRMIPVIGQIATRIAAEQP